MFPFIAWRLAKEIESTFLLLLLLRFSKNNVWGEKKQRICLEITQYSLKNASI